MSRKNFAPSRYGCEMLLPSCQSLSVQQHFSWPSNPHRMIQCTLIKLVRTNISKHRLSTVCAGLSPSNCRHRPGSLSEFQGAQKLELATAKTAMHSIPRTKRLLALQSEDLYTIDIYKNSMGHRWVISRCVIDVHMVQYHVQNTIVAPIEVTTRRLLPPQSFRSCPSSCLHGDSPMPL